jgi:hypothetical protein
MMSEGSCFGAPGGGGETYSFQNIMHTSLSLAQRLSGSCETGGRTGDALDQSRMLGFDRRRTDGRLPMMGYGENAVSGEESGNTSVLL